MSNHYPAERTYDDGNGNTCTVTLTEYDDGYRARCQDRPELETLGDTPEATLDAWATEYGDKVSNWSAPPDTYDASVGKFSTPT